MIHVVKTSKDYKVVEDRKDREEVLARTKYPEIAATIAEVLIKRVAKKD